MRDSSEELGDVLLGGGFSRRLYLDVFYDDERTLQDAPVVDYSFTWDLESATKSSGSVTIAYQGDLADSLTPRDFLDRLAPFGQQVNVMMEISYKTRFTEILQVGRFRITAVPEARDAYLQHRGRTLVQGSTVQLTLDDLLIGVQRWGFRGPQPPFYTESTYDEIQRISGLPILQTVADQPTPNGLIYTSDAGGRLTAVQSLASYLGGTAYTTPFGELSIVSFTPGPVVNTLTMDEQGRILDWPSSMDSANLYNEVVGTYQDADGNPIYSYAPILTGALAPDGPFGPFTYSDQAQGITTQSAADARAESVLAQLRSTQTYRISVKCILDPRTEVGDVVTLVAPNDTVTGRVISLGWPADGQMTITLDVALDVGL